MRHLVSASEVKHSIEEVIRNFPDLKAHIEENVHPVVRFSLRIEPNTRMPFIVQVSLQGKDELALYVGEAFMCEWFPINEGAVVSEALSVLCGVLAGEIRLLERITRGQVVTAKLQRLKDRKWQNVGTWAKLHVPSFFTRTRIRQAEKPAYCIKNDNEICIPE